MTHLSDFYRRFISILIPCLLLLIGVWHTAKAQQASIPQVGVIAGQPNGPLNHSPEPGLLFYLSGEYNFTPDFTAGGQHLPNFNSNVKMISDGAKGPAFHEDDWPLLSYWAPGNIYAQRGTVSFFWRSGYPVGPTPFPIFRVGYADNTSWDMAWLRIDYNGSGFDAFVTDVGLARTRVSYYMSKFPKPKQWTHIAFSWDETKGVKLYIDGKLVAQKSVQDKVYDTGLDQFGPTSRTISPMQVQSRYNFIRGCDYDEFRIYDRMLSDKDIAELARNETPINIPSAQRNLSNRRWRREWWLRHGWNLPNKPPAVLPSSYVTVKKVEIHNAVDVKRWMWKANDGIRETTWPGVYNMSRLPGRFDYFVLPDWDCYSVSGQSIKFHLPDEPWNHIEMWGTAWGQLTYESKNLPDYTFGVRTKEQIKSYQQLDTVRRGGVIRYDNALIENPIGEFGVYYVHQGKAPAGRTGQTFTLAPAPGAFTDKGLRDVAAFIDGRYPADEREKMVGVPAGSSIPADVSPNPKYAHPLIHVLIPYTNKPDTGLDGVEIHLPALAVKPTHGDLFPMEIRIKDPLWPMQDLTDFSFSIKPNKPYTLWFDTRNRILPKGRALYLTIAGAGADLTPQMLKGAQIRLVYETKKQAKKEDVADRLTQMKANYAFTVEEHPLSSRFNLFNRFMADYNDLIKIDPDNWLAKAYKFAETRNPKDEPEYKIPTAPAGIPEWAFLQVEYLKHIEHIVSYYIDNRQISNGEFGGGLSDDDDFTNLFPATAFMGIEPEKTLKSLRLQMTGFFDQDRPSYDAPLRQPSLPLFTNGLATNQYDQLHAYEDGIELIGQLELLDYGNPLYINRGMETDKRILNDVTQINPQGYRLFRSRDYSGTKMSTEDPWQWSGHYSYNMVHTSFMTVRYNGNPHLQKMIEQLADALLAIKNKYGKFYTSINFSTGKVRGRPGLSNAWQVFQAAYDYTGDAKYLKPIAGIVKQTRDFDPDAIVKRYKRQIRYMGTRDYIDTKGSIWIDRVLQEPFNGLQEDRLGGVALRRDYNIYPENYVSWKMVKPANYTSMAFFLPEANPQSIKVIAYNLDRKQVNADMTVWKVKPGEWRVIEGLDTNNDQQIDSGRSERIVNLERGQSIKLSFAPRDYSIVKLELIKAAKTGYWQRADLGIGPNSVKIKGNKVIVRVSSLGAINTPQSTLVLRDAKGERVSSATIPSMKAPLDLVPKWTDITLIVPKGTDLSSGSVEIDPDHKLNEITRNNNSVKW